MGKTGKQEALPKLPGNSTGIPKGSRYKAQYGVVIVCPDEAAQKSLYEGLKAVAGSKLKVVVT